MDKFLLLKDADKKVYFNVVTKEGGQEKYRQFEKKLNGKFIFIKGNHDRNNSLRTIITKMYLHYGAKDICMTHRPEHADPDVPLNFCGHVHQRYKVKRLNEKSLIVNLSVEAWNYYPVSFKEITSAVSAFLKEEKKTKPEPNETKTRQAGHRE